MASERQTFLGSSDAAAVCGLSKWRTPIDVWLEKTGQREPEDIGGKKAVRRGKMLEPVIRGIIAEEAGIEVTEFNKRYFEGDSPASAEIDFEFVLDNELCNGEIKTAYSRKDWGEEWTDQIPDYYMAQVQHGLRVTGRKRCLVIAAFSFDTFAYYMVELDEELSAWIKHQESDFWQHVQDRTEPDPITLDDCYAAYFTDSGEAMEAAPEQVEDVMLWRGLDKQIKGLSDQRDAVEMRLCRGLKDKQALVCGGKAIFTWKAQKHTHLDQKGLKESYPDLVKQYTVTKQIRVARAAGGEL